ncbi:DUF4148 domain-containing protein [Streptomyces sp. NPDC059071]|uniref:DUF4148 domain-containing protein n=1 Tax=unclassified Streptomyces TaxID=2593676 RepID=UPI00362CE115
MKRTATAVVLAAMVTLAATGCSGEGPGESGPLTKEQVREELTAARTEAGAPPDDPSWEALAKAAPADTWAKCLVMYKGRGTRLAPVDSRRYETVLSGLRERGWRQSGRTETGDVVHTFTKDGWSLVAEFRGIPATGQISLMATEDACVARSGPSSGPDPDG